MPLSFEIHENNGITFVGLTGAVDEHASFPSSENFTEIISLDLTGVKVINSVGIRSWLRWFGEMPDKEFRFVNCPKAVVMQMNMVDGFLPKNSTVESFHVPYYCESCDQELDVLFNTGKEVRVEDGEIVIKYDSSHVCEDGSQAELDVNKDKYFRFLLTSEGQQAAA